MIEYESAHSESELIWSSEDSMILMFLKNPVVMIDNVIGETPYHAVIVPWNEGLGHVRSEVLQLAVSTQ